MAGVTTYINALAKCREQSMQMGLKGAFFSTEIIDQIIALLKEQVPVKPYQEYNGHDIWRCGKCGATICNIYHTEADEDSKNYAKFCMHCGSAIEWESA